MKKSFVSRVAAVLFSTLILINSILVSALEVETADTPQKEETKVISWDSKIEPYLLEVMEKTEDNKKIPVWLWMEDIDEAEVEKEVYTRTGLKEDNLAVVSETISDKLAIEISGMSEADSATQQEISNEFQAYLWLL